MYGLLLILILCSMTKVESLNLEVKFVAVVFRHGDRAPDNGSEMFPNDPYINWDFYPVGFGGLTERGKLRLFELGTIIRNLYHDLLGEKYYPNLVMCRSTDYERTQVSLRYLLNGLFPPSQFSNSFNSTSIPINVVPSVEDNLMVAELCPQYKAELARVRQLPEVVEKVEKLRPIMKDLTILTGKNIDTTYGMYNLYHTFVAESTMGLPLVPWAYKVFPDGLLLDGIVLDYRISTYNNKLKRLFGGMLLRNILESMLDIANGVYTNERKMNLFSGHETNVASLLLALNVFERHVPAYGSALLFELLSDANNFYIKVRYYLGIPSETKDLQIPGCNEPCPLQDFVDLMRDIIPSDMEKICPKTETYTNTIH